GIRDKLVTGVQTCALPISSTKAFTAQLAAVTLLALKLGLARDLVDPTLVRQVVKGLSELPDLLSVVLRQSDAIRRIAERFVESRSEERRVGKECRSRTALW